MIEVIAIYLLCAGGGAHQVNGGAIALDSHGDAVTVSGAGRVGYRDEVQVEIVGREGRIRVPDGIKPPLRSGGDDGWWKLKGLDVRENEIRGQISLNLLNKPSLRINRLNGHISIRGRTGNFDGYCELYDPNSARRKF
jgi:hypothetical protein